MRHLSQQLIADFDPTETKKRAETGTGLTIWVEIPLKGRFDALQRVTGKAFGDMLKAMVIEAIDGAYVKAGSPAIEHKRNRSGLR